jgi:hypothetical protein
MIKLGHFIVDILKFHNKYPSPLNFSASVYNFSFLFFLLCPYSRLLGSGGSGGYLHAGQHKPSVNEHRLLCLKGDSNTRPQCLIGRKQLMSWTARSVYCTLLKHKNQEHICKCSFHANWRHYQWQVVGVRFPHRSSVTDTGNIWLVEPPTPLCAGGHSHIVMHRRGLAQCFWKAVAVGGRDGTGRDGTGQDRTSFLSEISARVSWDLMRAGINSLGQLHSVERHTARVLLGMWLFYSFHFVTLLNLCKKFL